MYEGCSGNSNNLSTSTDVLLSYISKVISNHYLTLVFAKSCCILYMYIFILTECKHSKFVCNLFLKLKLLEDAYKIFMKT